MASYLIAQISIHDRDEYRKYEGGFMHIFSRYGGRLLAVDEQPELLEGEWPFTRTVLVEFPDREAALAWYQSEEYQQLASHRRAASGGNIVMVSGL